MTPTEIEEERAMLNDASTRDIERELEAVRNGDVEDEDYRALVLAEAYSRGLA